MSGQELGAMPPVYETGEQAESPALKLVRPKVYSSSDSSQFHTGFTVGLSRPKRVVESNSWSA